MKRAVFILTCILSAAVADVCAYLSYIKSSFENAYLSFAVYFPLLAVSIPLASVLHEIGHFFFGAAVRVMAIPKFRLFAPSSCKIVPTKDKGLKGRIIFTACGGLAVNFLCIILGVLSLTVRAIPTEISAILPYSLYLFLINAFPFWYGDGKTDGLVISELIKNEDTAKVMLAVLSVQAQTLQGKKISEIDETMLFSLPQIREDDENFIALTYLRYMYFEEKGDTVNAEKYRSRFESLKSDYLN